MLKLPSGPSRPLPYLITLVPPLILSLLDPDIFFKALDFAGTYGGKIYVVIQQLKSSTTYLYISVHSRMEDIAVSCTAYLHSIPPK